MIRISSFCVRSSQLQFRFVGIGRCENSESNLESERGTIHASLVDSRNIEELVAEHVVR